MSSPQNFHLSTFIKIDRRKSDPVYLQIVYQLINAVQLRILDHEQQLPGSRSISDDLAVHRKTIVAAINELKAQGWVETKPGVGTFVINPLLTTTAVRKNVSLYVFPEKAGFSFKKSFVLEPGRQKNDCTYRLTDGTPDYRIIKTHELARLYSVALKRKNLIKRLPELAVTGNPFFKKQLSYYLNLTRGFHLAPKNLMIARSKEVLLYILTQLLVRQGDVILVGQESYHFSNMVLRQAGATIKTVPVATDGLDVAYIQRHFKRGEIRAVYVQPQHQYPTTATLSEDKRQALITLAEAYDFILIEDDTNFELSFEKTAPPALIKRDQSARVIYLGAFGQFLTPGFQFNFMLAPQDMIEEAQNYLRIFGHTDVVKEQALGEMINAGDIHRYRRKALNLYRTRRDYFSNLLQTQLEEHIKFSLPRGGLAFWIEFKTTFPLDKFAIRCQKKGLFIPRICLYQHQHLNAIRVGFGHLNEREMDAVIQLLKQAIAESVVT